MSERNVNIEDTLIALVDGKKYNTLRDVLITMNPADIASVFDDMPEQKLPLLFRLLPKELAAETFVEMESDLQEMLIKGFSDNELKDVIEELYIDDAVDIVEEMPANVVNRILENTDPSTRKMINEILKYPEDSAGSIMTIEYVRLRADMTVSEALRVIRKTGIDKETIYTCYVVNSSRKLIGMVSAKTLLLSGEDDVIGDIMETNLIYVHTLEDKEVVANNFKKYDFLAMPVVDDEQRLVGIVTVDDAIDVMEDEATEDIEKMAAIIPTDKPYLQTSAFATWKVRIPWLLLLMISATFTGIILTKFENALAAHITLSAFIPMLMDTGGNSGSQAAVSVIRSISLGELEFKDIFRVIWKEARVAVLCGVTLAAVNFVKVYLIDYMLIGNMPVFDPVTISVVCITVAVTVVIAKVIGCTLPIFADKLGFDPAVMASPFITTIVDALSLLVYFSIATRMLHF